LPDEVAVRWVLAARDPFFSPAIQAIPDSGLLTNLRRHQMGLFDDEVLRFTVAGVVLNSELEVEAAFHVLHARLAQRTLRGQGSLTRAQERHDGLFEFVLSQLLRGGDPDALGEVLQLLEIPIAVLEVAQRHRRKEGVRHAVTAYLFRRRRPKALAIPRYPS